MRKTPCVEGWCGPMASSSSSPSPSGSITGGRFQPSTFSTLVSATLIPSVPCSLFPVPLGGFRRAMFLMPLQHLIVRRGLVLKVIRLHVIAAHRVVLESVPHENAAQVGMARKDDPVEIEDLALLKLGRAPHGRKRRQLCLIGAVHGAHAQHQRTTFLGHGVKMVN